MKDRILKLITEYAHGSNLEFSKQTGINNATLSNLKSGKTNPTLDMVYKIQDAFPKISLNWLINGDGDMYGDIADCNVSIEDNKVVQTSIPFETESENILSNPIPNSMHSELRDEETVAYNKSENRLSNSGNPTKLLEKKITQIIVVFNDGTVMIK